MKKRIAYDYLFNYFGGDIHNGKIVAGAGITLNIRAYRDGEEILFEEGVEPQVQYKYLSDIYKVSYDKKEQFIITKNMDIEQLFCKSLGWDRIEAEAISYSLDIVQDLAKNYEQLKDLTDQLPTKLLELPVCEPVTVSEQEFQDFLTLHKDDFDITDNKSAQVPSVMFLTAKCDTFDSEDPAISGGSGK